MAKRKSSEDGDWAIEQKTRKSKKKAKAEHDDDAVELVRKDRIRKKKPLAEDFIETDKAVQEHRRKRWKPKVKPPDFVSRSVRCVMEKVIKGVESIEEREKRKKERDETRLVKRQLKLDEMLKKRKASQILRAEQKQLKQVNPFEFPAAAVNVPIANAVKPVRQKPCPTVMMRNAQKMCRALPQKKFAAPRAMPEYLEHLMKTPTSSNTVQFRVNEQASALKVDNYDDNSSYHQYSYEPSYPYSQSYNTSSNAWQQAVGIRQPMILLKQLAQSSQMPTAYERHQNYGEKINTPQASAVSNAGEYSMAYPSTSSAVSNSVPLPPFSAVHRQSPKPYMSPFESHFKGFIESTYNRYLSCVSSQLLSVFSKANPGATSSISDIYYPSLSTYTEVMRGPPRISVTRPSLCYVPPYWKPFIKIKVSKLISENTTKLG